VFFFVVGVVYVQPFYFYRARNNNASTEAKVLVGICFVIAVICGCCGVGLHLIRLAVGWAADKIIEQDKRTYDVIWQEIARKEVDAMARLNEVATRNMDTTGCPVGVSVQYAHDNMSIAELKKLIADVSAKLQRYTTDDLFSSVPVADAERDRRQQVLALLLQPQEGFKAIINWVLGLRVGDPPLTSSSSFSFSLTTTATKYGLLCC
jgi:hypothetical protein